MSSAKTETSPWLASLAQHEPTIRLALFALPVLFAILPVVRLIQHPWAVAVNTLFLWCAFYATVTFAVAVFYNLRLETSTTPPAERIRLLLMTLGGLIGVGLAALGFVWGVGSWVDLRGGVEAWQKKPSVLVWPGATIFVGLGLAFVSLQLGRTIERASPTIRWVVYGFNTLITSLVLLIILALVNVFAFAQPFAKFFEQPSDWTQNRINSIQPATRSFLADLDQDVQIFALLNANDYLLADSRALLALMKGASPKVKYEVVPTNLLDSAARHLELIRKYNIAESQGLLVVVGKDHEFIDKGKLAQESFRRKENEPLKYTFTGESAVVNAIRNLTEGKTVIYFTEGSGEVGATAKEGQRSIGGLKSRLGQRRTVEVKEFKLGLATREVPEDADVVVMVGPRQRIAPQALEALRRYVKGTGKSGKKGKLLLMLDPIEQTREGQKEFVETGLEGLLLEHGVTLGNNRIYCLAAGIRIGNPNLLPVVANPNSGNPIAKAFSRGDDGSPTQFDFTNCRTVSPAAKEGPGAAFRAESLLIAPEEVGVWAERDPTRDPRAMIAEMRRKPALIEKTISKTSLDVAVTVSASSGPAGLPFDAAHAGVRKDQPLMVVFGSSNWVLDRRMMRGRGGQIAPESYDLFASCVSWLRGQSSIGRSGQELEGASRVEYRVNLPGESYSRLLGLPIGLMVLAVIGLGCGVWVVRRR